MSETTSNNIGTGIVKTSARPIEIHVDEQGEYWICDKGVDPTGILADQGCVAHSEVHCVK